MPENIKNKVSRGFIAIVALLVISSLVAIITFTLSSSILAKKQISADLLHSAQSYYSAESGIEDAVLRKIKGYNLPSGALNLDGASIVQALSTAGDTTTIDSVSTYLNDVRKLRTLLTITTENISFYYGVQVGEGGVTMNGGATINGNIYSDGNISGNGQITGDAYVATGMTLDGNGDWENYSGDRDFGAKSSPAIDVAMKFIPSASGNLSQLSFYVKRTSDAPSSGTIRILKDKSNLPSDSLSDQLASTAFDVSKIGTNYGWVNYSFASPASLTVLTPYWIVIDVSKSSSDSKYYSIGKSAGNTDMSKYSANWTGGSWAPANPANDGGYDYKAWIGGAITSISGVTVGGNAHAHEIGGSTIGKNAYATSALDGSNVSGDAYAVDITGSSKICGNGHYTTIDSASLNFLNNPGSPCASPFTPGNSYAADPTVTDPAVEAMPISDSNIADWESEALTGPTYSDSAHCSPSGNITMGPAVLDCDLSLSSNRVLTVSGTLWVKGNISLSGGSVIQLASGYGTNSGAIIADKPTDMVGSGKISVSGSATICGSPGYDPGASVCNPSNGSYVLMLSTNTSSNAMSLSGGAAGAIFYAAKGTATLSGGANLKEVTAYALNLTGGSSVTYESGLAIAAFSSGPGAGWAITRWNETQ